MSSCFNIGIVGDPMLDVYHIGRTRISSPHRFIENECRTFPGGAANVNENLSALIGDQFHKIRNVPTYRIDRSSWIQLHRFVEQKNYRNRNFGLNIRHEINLEWGLEKDIGPERYADDVEDAAWVLDSYISDDGPNGLIIADYDRGYASKAIPDLVFESLKKKPFNFVIVDSRKATYNEQWLELSPITILHATNDELGDHQRDFSYTFHTQGPNVVNFYKGRELVDRLPVPRCENIVDTTGAGDTFVASVAYYLATHQDQPWDNICMKSACVYAISCCQQVIQHLGPATPVTE